MKTVAKKESMSIQGVKLGGLNPLPVLKEVKEDKEILTDGTLTAEEKRGLGKKTGIKVLPYLMQNQYSRHKEVIQVETIVLENDYMKATFLPTYGGRLYSLYSKILGKELLFKNPVIQPANLAIRDAWIAGGIEWNIGRVGHSVTTSDTLFAGVLTDEQGNDFVRMYEFERQNRLYWQVDFHLSEDTDQLWTYVKIMNLDDEEKHLYWWTNSALPLTEKTRVFSNTDEVFYIQPYNLMLGEIRYGHAQLPFIEKMGKGDMTYPEKIHYGSEYFFQNGKEEPKPWEAVVYEDGSMFYECSTQPLRIRKMFTWGNTPGGKNWQDFLALQGQGAYVEIQAGLEPSQLNGGIIGANGCIDFTQVFAATKCDLEQIKDEEKAYKTIGREIGQIIEQLIPKEEINKKHQVFKKLSQIEVEKHLNTGSDYGKIEQLRSGVPWPCGMTFEQDVEDNLWAKVLKEKRFPKLAIEEKPQSYMTDYKWVEVFKTLENVDEDNWAFLYYYGIFLFENNAIEQALEKMNQSLNLVVTPWASYAKAMMYERMGKQEGYLELLEQAYELGKDLSEGFVDKLLMAYVEQEMYQEAYALYLQEAYRDETGKWLLIGAKAGLMLGDLSLAEQLYQSEVANIREGDNNYTIMWFEYYARKYAMENDLVYTKELLEEVTKGINPPLHLDYRMNPEVR